MSPNTGLPTVYVDTNESGGINDTETYLEGRFTMTGSTAFPQCTAVVAGPDEDPGPRQLHVEPRQEAVQLLLDKKANVCGMGSDKKWALLANHYDRSLMRNSAASVLGRPHDQPRVHAAVDRRSTST